MRGRHLPLLLTALLCGTQALVAQGNDAGTSAPHEYWLVFQRNFRDYVTDARSGGLRPADRLDLELTLTAPFDARGTVQSGKHGAVVPFRIAAGQVLHLPIDSSMQLRSNGVVEPLSIHVVAGAANAPVNVALNCGDVYQIIAIDEGDLTGTSIESNKPIAVYSGHNCAYVPDAKNRACNMLAEQIPPMSAIR